MTSDREDQLGREERLSIESDDAARGVAHFKVVHQGDGRFHWELINPRGTPTGRSMEDYPTEDEAVAAAEQAKRLISGAPVRRS